MIGEALPYVYEVTKYNPADRDEHGHYTGSEPVDSDHGPVEGAYLEAVAAFAEESGVDHLAIREPQISGFVHFGLEPVADNYGLTGLLPGGLAGFHDGAVVPVEAGLQLVRAMLRDSGAWCRLEVEGLFTVHVGWDQYLYVGSSRPCERALARTRSLGLFPRRRDASPYDFTPDAPLQAQRPADDDFWARLHWAVGVHRAVLLEETYVGNASRWHRLTRDTIEVVRSRLIPRAQLAVWPDLLTDVDTAMAALPDEGLVEIVWEDLDGQITSAVVDETRFDAETSQHTGARAAAVLPLTADERQPLFTAVLPDGDGVLRARWQTETTPGDRDWALLRTLRRGQTVTGTVSIIASFGVTFVNIGGFDAMINLPELSWRPFDHPSDIVRVGQEIVAEILDVDMIRERVSLSLRALQEDPWPRMMEWIGQVVTRPVTKVVPFGVYVRVEDRPDGFEGFVHTSELDESLRDAIETGDTLTVKILDVDLARRRISLSHKQALAAGATEDGTALP
ncbi:S1 RNA-binding domain-containing protein [Streptomyces collinus]|uniref:S1 RNA-binding domain-containing protein n=1 Tax=Streptomyces collinus TaxID=42684 RepID=UPI00369ABA06